MKKSQAAPKAEYQEFHYALVRVYSLADNSAGSGTLVYADPESGLGIVLTAAHVVRRNALAKAKWGDGSESTGTVLYWDQRQDAAAFQVKLPKLYRTMPLAESLPDRGAKVQVLGYPTINRRRKWTARYATVMGVKQYNGWLSVKPSVSDSGDSGGAIATEDGKLLAVISGGVTNPPQNRDTHGGHALEIRTGLRQCYPRCFPGQQPIFPSQPVPVPPGGDTVPPPPGGGEPQQPPAQGGGCDCQPIAGPPGPPGCDGQDGQDADPAVVADLVVLQIKTDPELQDLLRGPAGPQGPPGSDGGGPGLPDTNAHKRWVVIGDPEARYYNQLEKDVLKTKTYYDDMDLYPPPKDRSVGPLPALVLYVGGKRAVTFIGTSDVRLALSRIRRGEFQ